LFTPLTFTLTTPLASPYGDTSVISIHGGPVTVVVVLEDVELEVLELVEDEVLDEVDELEEDEVLDEVDELEDDDELDDEVLEVVIIRELVVLTGVPLEELEELDETVVDELDTVVVVELFIELVVEVVVIVVLLTLNDEIPIP